MKEGNNEINNEANNENQIQKIMLIKIFNKMKKRKREIMNYIILILIYNKEMLIRLKNKKKIQNKIEMK